MLHASERSGGWLREPLLHFLVLGLGLFGLAELWGSRAARGAERERIDVTATEVERLAKGFEARWFRAPTTGELRSLVDDRVRREVLYREALAMGLDRDDEIIQRRMVQKIEFMTEDLATRSAPAEAELQSFLREHLDDYRIPERRRFEHVFLNADRRGEAVFDEAEALLAELRASRTAVDVQELGDRLMLEAEDRPRSEVEVGRLYGQAFARSLFELAPGDWQGPVGSGFGLHLVRVTELQEGAVPELAEVRAEVARDYATSVRERAGEAIYTGLATRYDITIDEEAIRARALDGAPGTEAPARE